MLLSPGRIFSRLFQYYNCCNPLNSIEKVASPPSLHRCFCGRGSKKSESNRAACRDCPANRKSKYPCLKLGVSCSSACQCLDCGNPHNQTIRKHATSACSPTLPKKRKRSNIDPYKRKGGSNYLSSQGFDVSVGPWRDLETLLLLWNNTWNSYTCICTGDVHFKQMNDHRSNLLNSQLTSSQLAW